jgi:dinuclear metal center YbgI/SA1388 family protein
MKLSDLCSYLDSVIPLSLQEEYDNSGIQLGSPGMEVKSALLSLDITEDVVDEAKIKKCDIIITHHPLIFKNLKRLSDRNHTERIIRKAIESNIAVYSAHTNLDAYDNGVSRKMAEKLMLKNINVLSKLKRKLLKLVVYVPESHYIVVRDALFEAGAGAVGKYDNCGFITTGTGSFRGNNNSRPFIGEKGKNTTVNEIRFETILYSHQKNVVLEALHRVHPYEEIAYDLYILENDNVNQGFGAVGMLDKETDEKVFIKRLSEVFDAQGIRYSSFTGKKIKKVALCGGSGSETLENAIASGADVLVTADIKYHTFFDADDKILLVDIGHFESEKFSTEILYDLIIKKFPKFAVLFSETNTNPINYL